MTLSVQFSSDLDSFTIDQNFRISYDDIHEFCQFKITINTDDLVLIFSSGILTTNYEDIKNFVYKFVQRETADISFNCDNGSCVSYNSVNNCLSFLVYTWKEGTTTDSFFSFIMNDEKHSIFCNIFHKLLSFKTIFDSLIIYEEEDENEYNYSCDEQDCDEQ